MVLPAAILPPITLPFSLSNMPNPIFYTTRAPPASISSFLVTVFSWKLPENRKQKAQRMGRSPHGSVPKGGGGNSERSSSSGHRPCLREWDWGGGGQEGSPPPPPSCLILVVFLLSGSPLPNKKRLERGLMLLASQPSALGRGKDPGGEAVAAITR